MSRTETCPSCKGTGNEGGNPSYGICIECGGNGYVSVDVSQTEMAAALEADGEILRQLTGEDHGPFPSVEAMLGVADEPMLFPDEAPAKDIYADVAKSITDLTSDKPTPGRMANQTWRILEEQRMAAKETIRECEAEIERWTDKMVDAHKTLRMAEAGQAVLDGAI